MESSDIESGISYENLFEVSINNNVLGWHIHRRQARFPECWAFFDRIFEICRRLNAPNPSDLEDGGQASCTEEVPPYTHRPTGDDRRFCIQRHVFQGTKNNRSGPGSTHNCDLSDIHRHFVSPVSQREIYRDKGFWNYHFYIGSDNCHIERKSTWNI